MRKFVLLALVLGLATVVPGVGHAAPTPGPIEYVAVDDGTEIAVRVYYPSTFTTSHKYPALVEIEGYGGAASPNDTSYLDDPDYVVVAISIRGTGCSAGTLDLFSERSSKDGAFIIDNWIPTRTWSNGDVGIYGHSYGGLTGFLVAAEHPTHLKAVAVSGLIDDFYRGILYPGGISNFGFPILWGGVVRPAGELPANAPLLADPHCAQNFATHLGSDVAPTPNIFLDTYGSRTATADSWAIRNALLTHAPGLRAPIQLGQQYQDEQTGPRGGHVLWQNIPAGLPKRIAISTGRHNPNDPLKTKKDWLDCWIIKGGDPTATTPRGRSCAPVLDPSKRVMLYFESKGSDRLAPYTASDWPLPETVWTRMKLCANGTLGTGGPACDGTVSYASSGTGRHMTADVGNAVATGAPLAPYGFTTGLPDTARYTLPTTTTTALAGPLELSLWATATSADFDIWAEVLDLDTATGATSFVQRGLLRASARALDESKSQKTPGGDIYRPYHPYLISELVTPGEPTKYEVEIFPLGHVWRPGHSLVLQLHAPPTNDPISTYAYEPNSASVVTVLQDDAHPTTILLPVMPTLPPMRDSAPKCGSVIGEVCVTPALG